MRLGRLGLGLTGQRPRATDPFAANGFKPPYVADFVLDRFRVANANSTRPNAMTIGRAGLGTMVDSDGVLKWGPHNYLTNSADTHGQYFNKHQSAAEASAYTDPFGHSAQRIYYSSAVSALGGYIGDEFGGRFRYVSSNLAINVFRVGAIVKAGSASIVRLRQGFIDLSDGTIHNTTDPHTVLDLGDGWYAIDYKIKEDHFDDYHPLMFGTGSPLVEGDDVYVSRSWLYRSDLGGMAPVPLDERVHPDLPYYVPTTTAAVYLPRRGHHVYEGGEWVKAGMLVEPGATNLVLNSETLATQDVTVTAVAHTLSFTGTGTVTLSGASTAGPLVGTGTGEENRVSLTFTPTAGTLTLTVSGTVTKAQLEVGSVPSSYIPTSGAQVARVADTVQVEAASAPAGTTGISIALRGRVSYADGAAADQAVLASRAVDANNRIRLVLDTDTGGTGSIAAEQVAAGTTDRVVGVSDYAPGIMVPISAASRHTAGAVQVAHDGTAVTADETPTALASLSAQPIVLTPTVPTILERIAVWNDDIDEAGVEEASA